MGVRRARPRQPRDGPGRGADAGKPLPQPRLQLFRLGRHTLRAGGVSGEPDAAAQLHLQRLRDGGQPHRERHGLADDHAKLPHRARRAVCRLLGRQRARAADGRTDPLGPREPRGVRRGHRARGRRPPHDGHELHDPGAAGDASFHVHPAQMGAQVHPRRPAPPPARHGQPDGELLVPGVGRRIRRHRRHGMAARRAAAHGLRHLGLCEKRPGIEGKERQLAAGLGGDPPRQAREPPLCGRPHLNAARRARGRAF